MMHAQIFCTVSVVRWHELGLWLNQEEIWKKKVITMELVYCLLSTDWKKNQTFKNVRQLYASRPIIVTDKIITSSNSLVITSKVKFFWHFVEGFCYYYFITGKILKVFDKVSEEFDLVKHWADVGELMTLPVVISSYN